MFQSGSERSRYFSRDKLLASFLVAHSYNPPPSHKLKAYRISSTDFVVSLKPMPKSEDRHCQFTSHVSSSPSALAHTKAPDQSPLSSAMHLASLQTSQLEDAALRISYVFGPESRASQRCLFSQQYIRRLALRSRHYVFGLYFRRDTTFLSTRKCLSC